MFKLGDVVIIKDEGIKAKVIRYSDTYHNMVYIIPINQDECATFSAFEDELELVKEKCLC